MPTDMKKRLMNASRNGIMSLSAWWLYSDSEMARPAMNAPSASDSPAWAVSQAVPMPMKMIIRINKLPAPALYHLLEYPGHRESGAVMGGKDNGDGLGGNDDDLRHSIAASGQKEV